MAITLTDAELDDLYERSKLDHEIIVGSEIRILIAEIRQHREIAARLDRVDTALAKRVGDMIAQHSAFKIYLTDWLRCYNTDIFPEPDLKKAAEVLKANDMTINSLSAEMGRHVLGRVIAKLDEPD